MPNYLTWGSKIVAFISILFLSNLTAYADDDSRYWKKLSLDKLDSSQVEILATSPSHSDIIYAQEKGIYISDHERLLKSYNKGKSWVHLPFNSELALPGNNFDYSQKIQHSYHYSVDSNNPNILFASSENTNKLYKSSDGGIHWYEIASELEIDVSSFFILNTSITQSLKILVHTSDKKRVIAESHDSGEHWLPTEQQVSSVETNPSEERIVRLEAVDPQNENIWYGVDYTCCEPFSYLSSSGNEPIVNRLYKSIDSGLNWDDITPLNVKMSSEDFFTVNVVIDPQNSEKFLATFIDGSSTEVSGNPQFKMETFDGGKSWFIHRENVLSFGESETSLIGGGGDLSISSDDRVMFFARQETFENETFGFGTYYKSFDKGLSWESFFISLPEGELCTKFVFNPKNSKEAICTAEGGFSEKPHLYITHNTGKEWHLIDTSLDISSVDLHNIDTSTVMYSDDGKKLFAKSKQGIIESLDQGKTWTVILHSTSIDPRLGSEAELEIPMVDSSNTNIKYIEVRGVDKKVLYKSTDSGKNWVEIKILSHSYDDISMNPFNSDQLISHSGSIDSVGLSNDGGTSWQQINVPAKPQGIMFSKKTSGALWLISDDMVYESLDMGLTWNAIDKGLGIEYSNSGSSSYHDYIETSGDDTYLMFDTGVFKLAGQGKSSGINCLFSWAEKNYPALFSPAPQNALTWGGYTYRYYSDTDTYLGFFLDQEVHILKKPESQKIDVIGSIDSSKNNTGCP